MVFRLKFTKEEFRENSTCCISNSEGKMLFINHIILVFSFIMGLLGQAVSLECYSCSHVVNSTDCRSTVTCSNDQVCYKKREFTSQIYFDFGCVDKQSCGRYAKIPNRTIAMKMDGGQTQYCYECCSSDNCNKNLCKHSSAASCADDETVDCARWNSLFSICEDINKAKLICPKYCNLCHVVDGNWSPWSSWSECDVSCENGTESRVRSCTNPPPKYGGLDCPGEGIDSKTCQRQLCPVHGGWSDWGPWGTCPETCGIGMMSRTRSCTNPVPDRFGDHCFGNSLENALCHSGPCAIVNGGWSGWAQWDKCSVTCGVGMQSRARSCNNPKPKGYGKTCSGRDLDVKLCYPGLCATTDCYDVLKKQNAAKSGVYNVTLWRSKQETQVYCDMETDNGGWTVFQYRFNGLVDFYRNFTEYERGFGDLGTEFWLGLIIVEEMAAQGKTELRLDLTAAGGITVFENFQNFVLGSSPNYTLNIDPGTGTAGDGKSGLSYHNGNAFSTYDIDRDRNSRMNCAVYAHGAWWYNNCLYVNLNGMYVTPGSRRTQSMIYHQFNEFYSLKASKMMFRRV
ncbi:uncharacterized protein LOC128551395 [Mercenaria mercenaria]|uniref:uncharacterized protein LOC128551395 n=1 Tax=Mercenaria mercenaria TaxID=6596 RepID=UPI00234F94CF|nr:uncharacterized protein LOC128551395 [Mercenaria mercenaria]